MKIKDAIALVTGANRGLGLHFVEALVEFGAVKIYATARNSDTLDPLVRKHEGLVVPLGLDVTQQAQVDAVAEAAQDVTLLLVFILGIFCSSFRRRANALRSYR